MSGVKTLHPEYKKALPKWELVDNLLAADVDQYLRNVGKSEKGEAKSLERQREYEEGAILDNFTQKTLTGLCGAAFLKPPQIELPTQIEYLRKDVDGAGTTITQQAAECVDQDLRKARVGLLVDMPETDGATTLASMESGATVPRIMRYYAESIINWNYVKNGSAQRLSLVVLAETIPDGKDIFDHDAATQYRVLALDENGYYYQQLYNEDGEAGEQVYPRENGSLMREIPFYFVGVADNTANVDASPIYPIAELNIGHYRNSADTEENSFICSQAMLILAPSEMMSPEQWAKENPDGVRVGSRRGLNVGAGGSAEFIQAQESDKAMLLMDKKKQQAVELGAQIITPTQQVTAEAARIQQSVNHSILSAIANNITEAYRRALDQCARFLGVQVEDISFALSNDFYIEKLNAQDRAQWVSEIIQGITPRALYYRKLRESGDFPDDWTDEQIATEIEQQGLI